MICTIDPSINEKSRFSLCHIRRRKNWFLFVSNSFVSVLVGRTDRYSLIHLTAEGIPADRNAVLQVAEQVQQNEITFEDAGAEQDAEQNATCNVPYPANAWYAMATDETLPLAERDEAAKQLEMLADGGDRYAQYLTGILYRDGGLLLPDTEKAQHYLGLAAQQNHAAAQYALGKLLLSDDPEVQNPA